MCLDIVCVEGGFSQIWSQLCFVEYLTVLLEYTVLSTLPKGHRKHLDGPEYNIVLVISLLGINENWSSLFSTSTHPGYVNDFKCSMLITITINLKK